MRSVFTDNTEDFFEILTYPKELWYTDFWTKYKKKKPRVTSSYMKQKNFTEKDIEEKFNNTDRTYIDKAYRYREEVMTGLKSDIIKLITHNTEKYNLTRGDYSVQIGAMFGEEKYFFVETFHGTIIFVDFLYYYKHKDTSSLEDIIDEAITDFISNYEPNRKKADLWIVMEDIKNVVNGYRDKNSAMKKICEIIDKKLNYYNWTGFYLVDEKDKNMLILGPYIGEETDHVKIEFGKGICGQAASTKATFLIGDVSKESNYLSCSPKTKSEIVVPVFDKNGNIVGEIDIDSHFENAFDGDDREFLEVVARMITEKYF